jgi:hypothetical protein
MHGFLFGGHTKRLAAYRNCPKIFHGGSQITPAHPSSHFMTDPLYILILYKNVFLVSLGFPAKKIQHHINIITNSHVNTNSGKIHIYIFISIVPVRRKLIGILILTIFLFIISL